MADGDAKEALLSGKQVVIARIVGSGISMASWANIGQRLVKEGLLLVDYESFRIEQLNDAVLELKNAQSVGEVSNTFVIDSLGGFSESYDYKASGGRLPEIKHEAPWGKRVRNKPGGIPRRNGK